MENYLEVEKFIESVRLRTPLWNKHDPVYRNPDMSNRLWNEVAHEMGGSLTVAQLKHKWQNLRDCFRREVRTEERGKGKKKWIYYNQMLFLLSNQLMRKKVPKNKMIPIKIEPRDGIVQTDLTNANSNNSDFITSENISHENVIEVEENSLTQEVNQSEIENEEIPVFSNIGGESGIPAGNGRLEKWFPGTLESTRHRNRNGDSDYHFAMSIIPHLRHVPTHKKLRTRIRILEVIAQESGYREAPS